MSIQAINRQLAPHNVTLARGKGYFYYVYDDGTRFDTRSVYTQRLSDIPDDVWVSDGIRFAGEMQTCTEGMDARLANALVEAYNAILEAKVNREMAPLYNFCIKSGDWVECPAGKHEVKLELDTGKEIKDYVASHYPQGYEPRDAMLRKIAFSTTVNSDRANYKNKIAELHNAYKMACDAEYELSGYDESNLKWPVKMQQFMDKFCGGRTGWTPEAANLEDKTVKQAADVDGQNEYEPTKLTGENENIDTSAWGWDSWKQYANGKQKR